MEKFGEHFLHQEDNQIHTSEPAEYEKVKKEQQASLKRTLEIGVGGDPFFLAKEGRPLEDKEVYTGLDIDAESLNLSKERIDNRIRRIDNKENINFIRGNAENLPIKDASIDEVVMRETLDATSDYFRYKMRPFDKDRFSETIDFHEWNFEDQDAFKNLQKSRAYIKQYLIGRKYDDLNEKEQELIKVYYESLEEERVAQEAKMNFINETKRVIKENGRLTLVNTTTTEISKPFLDYLESDPFFKRVFSDDEIKRWKEKRGIEVFRRSDELEKFGNQVEEFFNGKEKIVCDDLINFTLGKRVNEAAHYFFRITSKSMEDVMDKDNRFWPASKSLLDSTFYLNLRFLKRLKDPSEAFTDFDKALYSPVLFIIDGEDLIRDGKIEEGAEAKEVLIEGDFSPYSLRIDSADKFMISLQFLYRLLPQEDANKLQSVFAPHLKIWRDIETLRRRRIP